MNLTINFLSMKIWEEIMRNGFTKWHVTILDITVVFHRFTETDKIPHDHSFPFVTFIARGGYIERVFQKDGSFEDIERKPHTAHRVEADCIHQIISLPNGTCWTIMLPEHKVKEWGFWDFSQTPAKFIPHVNKN